MVKLYKCTCGSINITFRDCVNGSGQRYYWVSCIDCGRSSDYFRCTGKAAHDWNTEAVKHHLTTGWSINLPFGYFINFSTYDLFPFGGIHIIYGQKLKGENH